MLRNDKPFWLKNIGENVLDLLFPPRCIVCDALLLPFKRQYLCDSCPKYFEPINQANVCQCGKPKTGTHCNTCKAPQTLLITQNRAAFLYADMPQELIYKFKFRKQPFVAYGLAQLMLSAVDDHVLRAADVIVPVPIHKKRLRARGFNQATLLAKQLTKALGIAPPKAVIRRAKNTKPLSGFSPKGRTNTLKDAFVLSGKYDVKGQSILLIDDIFTTGATLNACAKVLLDAGAKQVSALTFTVVVPKAKIDK